MSTPLDILKNIKTQLTYIITDIDNVLSSQPLMAENETFSTAASNMGESEPTTGGKAKKSRKPSAKGAAKPAAKPAAAKKKK